MEDGSPIGYLITIGILIILGAFLAGTETAMASANRIRMMSLSTNGDRRAKRVLYILDNFDKALTTLLICNNITHIGSASVATLMATKLWGVDAVGLTTVVTTLVVFLLAEMLPKRFAKLCNERYALAVSGALLFLMRVLSPIAFVFSKLSQLVSRPFKKDEEEPTVTEDELKDILDTAVQEGSIDEEKTELMQSALEFSGIVAADVMTPWAKVLTVTTAMTQEEILSVIKENNHSRLPVLDAEGNVVGLLHIRKYLKSTLRHEEVVLSEVMDDVCFVDGKTPIDDLLPLMSGKRTQTALVVDKEGNTAGIVSVEDILEELVGEIYDEDDKEGGAA